MEILKKWWNNNLTCAEREDIKIAANIGVGFLGVAAVIFTMAEFSSFATSPHDESFTPRTIKVEIPPAMQDCRWGISSVSEDNRSLVLACR